MKEKLGGLSEDDSLEAIPMDEDYENMEYYTLHEAINKILDYNEKEVVLNEDSNGSKQILKHSGKSGFFGQGLILLENGEPQKFIKVLDFPEYLYKNKEGEKVYGAEEGYYQANHAHYLLAKNYFETHKDFLKEKVLFSGEFDQIEDLLNKLEKLDKGPESYHGPDDKEFIKKVTFINLLFNSVENYQHRVEVMGEVEKDNLLKFPFPKFHSVFDTSNKGSRSRICTSIDMIHGETLQDGKQKFDTPEKRKKYFESLIDKVHLLHKVNFVHGDLKPDNVMASNEILLIDNGFVKYQKENDTDDLNDEWRSTALISLNVFLKMKVFINNANGSLGLNKEDILQNQLSQKYENYLNEMGVNHEKFNFLLFLAFDDVEQTSVIEHSGDDEIENDNYNMTQFAKDLKIQELEKFVMNSLEMEDLEGIDKEKIELFKKMQKAINKGLPNYLKEFEN